LPFQSHGNHSVDLDPEVSHGAFKLGVPEQQLNRTEILEQREFARSMI
jgi:hypothetical protein